MCTLRKTKLKIKDSQKRKDRLLRKARNIRNEVVMINEFGLSIHLDASVLKSFEQ